MKDFLITDFGASRTGGAKENAAAILKAVDAANLAGGGRVVVPEGTFLTGSIQLKSHVELHLAKGAVLKATTDLTAYNADNAYPQNQFSIVEEWSGAHIIYAVEEEDIAITGEGKIDGSGTNFFGDVTANFWPYYRYGNRLHPLDRDRYRTGQQIAIVECRNVKIEDITFVNSATWTCFLHGCEDVTVRNYKAFNDRTVTNTDGLSIDCCRNVHVSDCIINTGDDGIAIRASAAKLKNKIPCENIVIENCNVTSTCDAVRIGVGNGTIHNVEIRNCVFPESAGGIGFMCAWRAGQKNVFINDIRIKNCQIKEAGYPIQFFSAGDGSPSKIENISVEDCSFESVWGMDMTGGKNHEYNPRNIRFTNCDFTILRDFANQGEFCTDEIKLLDCFKNDAAFSFRDGEDFVFTKCRLHWPHEDGLWRWRVTHLTDGSAKHEFIDCDFSEPPVIDGMPEPVYKAPPIVEGKYDFRKRLSAKRQWRPAEFFGEPIKPGEFALDNSWGIVIDSDEPVVKHAAEDLRDFLEKRFWVKCKVRNLVAESRTQSNAIECNRSNAVGQSRSQSTCNAAAKQIIIAVKPEANKLTARINAAENEIVISGATPRETAQACYRFEDELTYRDQPFVKTGNRTYTRMYSPRMTHSGYEIEKFPDWHMDQIAHAGMDAILVYIREPPDITRNGREDMNELVRRAAEHGLDVYAYFDRWGHPVMNPLDEGAKEEYEKLFGSIVKNAPGLKGMIIVGESCSFTSRDPGVYGYAWEGKGVNPDAAHPKKGCNGFWPALDWKETLELIRDTTRKYNPDFDVVFWTYNWFCTPEKDRVALLEHIPTDITLHVTYEMGDTPEKKLGVDTWIDDYSITRPGPGTTFKSEAAVAGRRGIKLTSMTNTGGRTWDFGAIPFEPVPYSWLERFRALRTSRENYGLSGLMDEHHYGFAPNFIAEIGKVAFTEEATDADVEKRIEDIAALKFGRDNAADVISAWKDWSDAMKWHSARVFDQYGVLRIGSTYPLFFYGDPIPDAPEWLGDEPGHKGGRWIYLCKDPSATHWAGMPKELIPVYIEMAEKELTFWKTGNDKLANILDKVHRDYRQDAARILGIGKYCECTTRTSINVKRFWQTGFTFKDTSAPMEQRNAAKNKLLAIIDAEEQNVRELLPYVDADSQLGWEPSMRYVCNRQCLEWKLEQLKLIREKCEL